MIMIAHLAAVYLLIFLPISAGLQCLDGSTLDKPLLDLPTPKKVICSKEIKYCAKTIGVLTLSNGKISHQSGITTYRCDEVNGCVGQGIAPEECIDFPSKSITLGNVSATYDRGCCMEGSSDQGTHGENGPSNAYDNDGNEKNSSVSPTIICACIVVYLGVFL